MLHRIPRPAALMFSAFMAFTSFAFAQAPESPKPTCIRNVSLGPAGEDSRLVTLILRDGSITAIRGENAPTPAGMREIDGAGLVCLPGFVDALTYTGVTSPSPVIDQDVPVDVGADVRVDMRLANRKGIQPAFRSASALAIEAKASEAWLKSGFGAAHISPTRNLLGGTSCVAATREAAARELVLRADAFSTAAFAATGRGYPQTLMGYIAQLRQFFMDAERHALLQERFDNRRPGVRPVFDADLEAGAAILRVERVLLCDTVSNRDVERWLKMSDRFGFKVAFAGGRDSWRVADEIAEREISVLLTTDWGKEVKDPLAKKKDKKKGKKKEGDDSEDPKPEAEAKEASAEKVSEDEEAERSYTYDEPLAVRIDKRKEWEKRRDCALRLHEAGIEIAFGSGKDSPADLLKDTRAMVEAGLPASVALEALTSTPARILGLGDRLGSVDVGYDATLTLWSADPITDKKATPIYVFVDGFETEYDRPKEKEEGKAGDGPAEGLDVSGSWSLESEDDEDGDPTIVVLVMAEDGTISGEMTTQNPEDQSELKADVSGSVNGTTMTLEATVTVQDMEVTLSYELKVDGDEVSGDLSIAIPVMPEPMEQTVTGSRIPDSRSSH